MNVEKAERRFATSLRREKSNKHPFKEGIYSVASGAETRSDLIKLSESLFLR